MATKTIQIADKPTLDSIKNTVDNLLETDEYAILEIGTTTNNVTVNSSSGYSTTTTILTFTITKTSKVTIKLNGRHHITEGTHESHIYLKKNGDSTNYGSITLDEYDRDYTITSDLSIGTYILSVQPEYSSTVYLKDNSVTYKIDEYKVINSIEKYLKGSVKKGYTLKGTINYTQFPRRDRIIVENVYSYSTTSVSIDKVTINNVEYVKNINSVNDAFIRELY